MFPLNNDASSLVLGLTTRAISCVKREKVPRLPERWPFGRRPAWCMKPGWRTWGRPWESPACPLKPGHRNHKEGSRPKINTAFPAFFFNTAGRFHLRELSVSEPLQPPHAVAGLPFAHGAPRHHDARPPGEALDLSPDQLADSKAFIILQAEQDETQWASMKLTVTVSLNHHCVSITNVCQMSVWNVQMSDFVNIL